MDKIQRRTDPDVGVPYILLICTFIQIKFTAQGLAAQTVQAVYTTPDAPYVNHLVLPYNSVEKFRRRQFKHCQMDLFSVVHI